MLGHFGLRDASLIFMKNYYLIRTICLKNYRHFYSQNSSNKFLLFFIDNIRSFQKHLQLYHKVFKINERYFLNKSRMFFVQILFYMYFVYVIIIFKINPA